MGGMIVRRYGGVIWTLCEINLELYQSCAPPPHQLMQPKWSLHCNYTEISVNQESHQ